jgi:hypothetical protein
MSAQSRIAVPTAALLGIGAVFAATPLIGYTMAIAMPPGLMIWLNDIVGKATAVFLWDLFVVMGPTIGLLVFLAAVVVRLIARGRPGVGALLSLGGGAMLALYLLVPLAYGDPIVRPLPLWASAAEIAVLLASLAALPILVASTANNSCMDSPVNP